MTDELPQTPFEIDQQADLITIKSPVFGVDPSVKWTAKPVDEDRIMLTTDRSRDSMGGAGVEQGMFRCTTDAFLDFLVGIHHRRWSGVCSVDTGYGVKKLFFTDGEVVFAGSMVMDDRLGEVIYRESMITLDQLTESAAQVDRDHKFGQVLLANNIFTNVDLYRALQLQVRQILRSIFMVTHVFVELRGGRGLAPTEVVFEEGASSLLDECYSYGCVYRDFLSRLREESRVELLGGQSDIDKYPPGTFKGDLLKMISEESSLRSVLDSSKLMDMYTIASLVSLVNEGLCHVTPSVPTERSQHTPELAPLREKIDVYLVLLSTVKKSFSDEAKQFPVEELRRFTAEMNPSGFVALFLNASGEIGRDCVNVLFSQCRANKRRVEYFVIRIDSLIQFLLQIAGDILDYQTAKAIRAQYREMVS